MQTILGSSGIIGRLATREVRKYTGVIKLASRNPQKVHDTDHTVKADLLDRTKVFEVVRGAEMTFLTAGLEYNAEVWEKQWPVIIQNAIDACRHYKSRLIFFDNVYAYGKVNGWMTEETPYNPCSRKGRVRMEIAEHLMKEHGKGNFEVMIVRSADFYGPQTKNSFLNAMVLSKFAKRKRAQWMLDDQKVHSFTYTPDAAKAMVFLGNEPDTFGQIWHLPTDFRPFTGQQLIEMAARSFGVNPRYSVYSRNFLKMIGWFNEIVKENEEMLYQNEFDYKFSSEKFRTAYPDFSTTSYEEGLRLTAESYRGSL